MADKHIQLKIHTGNGNFDELFPVTKAELVDVNGKKLSESLNEVAAQLAQTARKEEVFLKSNGININDMDEATRQTFLEAQGIDVNYVLGEQNVKPINTSFFIEQKGRNMLDPNKVVFGTWLGNTLGGTTATSDAPSNSAWNSFKAVEVEPDKDYIFVVASAFLTTAYADYSYWYDETGTAISRFSFDGVKKSPVNAKYVRASFKSASTTKLGVYQASAIAPQEDYRDPTYVFDTKFIPENSTLEKTKNLFDVSKVTYNKVLNNGNPVDNAVGWKVSDMIEVEPNTHYNLSKNYQPHALAYSYFYDENKAVISQITGNNPFITPENCMFVRFSIQYAVDYVQLEKGSEIKYYIPYGHEDDYKDLLNSPLLDKKYCPIGDSITASGWGYELARQTGMVINNYNAIGGTTVSGAYDGTTNMCGTTRVQATPPDTEIITVMGGSNDWSQQSQGGGIPVGELTDLKIGEDRILDSITFAGCYKLMLNRLYKQSPNAQIFVLEQTYRYLEDTDRTVPLDVFREKTREIAYEYGYPVIEMKQKCGFNEMNYQDFYIDIIHPNDTTGRNRIIEVVKSGVLSTIQ